ncbi:MAG: glycoside hydrolase family 3 N-terminal domain-containing protein [Ilumatobacteraceae bacterium]
MSTPTDPTATLTVEGLTFRDLDHDGVLAPYEDWRLPATERAADLLGRMTFDERIGLLLHGTAAATGGQFGALGVGPGYDLDRIDEIVNDRGVSSLISRLALPAEQLAEQANGIQAIAARGRLGIPVTMSTDPRHHNAATLGAAVEAGAFSVWPGPLGLAAIGDAELVRRFGEAVRREYRAVGFHVALSPQADLATSPRWPRIDGTFGEDPALVRRLVGAFVEGVQATDRGATGLGPTSVAAVVKHWVGYGASRDGFDGHNWYGRFSAFPGGRFADHVDAFRDALAAGVAGVMPTYNILDGLILEGEPVEPVAAGFNAQLLRLLREGLGFVGLILSDWAIVRDLTESGRTGEPPQVVDDIAMPWGVEHLDRVERFAKGVAAGIDQFGGEDDPAPLRTAVERGLVTPERIDESARRVLLQKFQLGLFDDPFVDPAVAARTAGMDDLAAAGRAAQRRSITVLSGRPSARLAATDTVHAEGRIAAALATSGVNVADRLDEATVAVVALKAPFERPHPTFFFGGRQHEGSLDFADDDPQLTKLREIAAAVPTIVVVHLDRPAVLTKIVPHARALLVELGVGADALADVLTGRADAEGRLPFQLSASMDAVLARPCDVPCADPSPLFDAGHSAP